VTGKTDTAAKGPALTERPNSFVPALGRVLGSARVGLMAACVLGVVLSQDAASADPLAPKSVCFALLLGGLPALSAAGLWWDAPLRFPPRSTLFALALFCGAASLSYFLSPLGPESRLSWQVWLLCALLLVAAFDVLSEAGGRRWLLRSLVCAAGLAGARGLAQRLGLDSSAAALADSASFGNRVAASFGNPNFAGGFFALVLPLLAQQALAAEGRVWRRVARVALVLAALGLCLSASKAAFLGLFVSAAVAGHLFFWSDAAPAQRKRALSWLAAALGLGLIVGGLCLPRDSLQRLAGGPRAWSDSVDFRRVTWEGTLDLARARPLCGWGPGTFSAAYPSFRRPEAMAAQQEHSYEVTAPENWLLQVFAESGLIGLAAALFLLAVLLWPLRKAARSWATDADRGLCLALLCCVAACLACNLASLDLFLPSTLMPLLLLLALGGALSAPESLSLSLNPQNYTRLLLSPNLTRVLVAMGLALMASVPVVQALLHSQAARLLYKGRALSQSGNFKEAVPVYQLALQFDPGLLEARYFLGNSLMDGGGPAALTQSAEAYAQLQGYAPDYVQVHAKLGRLDELEGRVPEAAQEYARQLALDPWDLGTVQALATLDARSGRLDEAAAVLQAASRRWPGNTDISGNLARVRAALQRRKGGA
jgi:O-antigen ligase/Flp pilus assembly protein TadD